MRFQSLKYDFGAIVEGASVQHTFEYTNNGTEKLVVSEVSSTCGCTVAGNYDREVPSGGNGKIPVTFDSTGYDGPVEKTVRVKTNDLCNPEYTLTLAGTVRMLVVANPNILWLGNIDGNRTAALEGTMTLTSRLPAPVAVTAAKPLDDNVEASVNTIKPGAEYSLAIKVTPPFKEGPVRGAVRLTTDNDEIREFTAYYSYYLTPLVAAYPNPLIVSRKSFEQGDEQTISIECQPGVDVRIAHLTVNDDRINVSSRETGGDVKKGKKFTLTIKFPRDFKLDPKAPLTVSFRAKNLPRNPLITVPILEGGE